MKKPTRRFIAGLLAAMTIFSAAFEPVASSATESTLSGGVGTELTRTGDGADPPTEDGGAMSLTVSDGDAVTATMSEDGTMPLTAPDGDAVTATMSEDGAMPLTVSDGDAVTATASEDSTMPLTVSDGDAVTATVSGGDAAQEDAPDTSLFLTLTSNSASGSLMRRSRSVGGLSVGARINYPSDLGGSYYTHYYTIDGNIAYCMQPDQHMPEAGNYELETKNDPNAIRSIVYGYGGPFQNVMAEWMAANGISTDNNTMYVYTHIAVSYYYTTNFEKAFTGVPGWQSSKAYAWIQYLYNNTQMPLTFSSAGGTAYVSKNDLYAGLAPGGYLRTEQIHVTGRAGTDWLGGRMWAVMYLGAYNLGYSWLNGDPYNDNFTGAETGLLSGSYSFQSHIKGHYYSNYGYQLKNNPSVFFTMINSASYVGDLNGAVLYNANACYHVDGDLLVKDSDEYYICMHKEREKDPGKDIHICRYKVSDNSYTMTEAGKRFLNCMIYQGTQKFKVRINSTGTGYTLRYVMTGSDTQDVGTLYSFSLPSGGSTAEVRVHYLTGSAVKIKKTDPEGNALSGAKFGIYEDAACTVPVSVIKYDPSSDRYHAAYIGDNGIVTTGSDGIADLGYISYYYEKIYVKEKEAPKNYKPDDAVHEINLADGMYHDASNPIILTLENELDSYRAVIVKKDLHSQKPLKGAVYEVYADEACTDKIGQFAPTGTDGTSTLSIGLEHSIVYLKEIQAPEGYILDRKIIRQNLADGERIEVYDSEQSGSILIQKTGPALRAVSHTDNAVLFDYADRALSGAHFQITAGCDIYDAGGSKRYAKGDIVAEDIVTDENGEALIDGLFIGYEGASYIVTETHCPGGYVITEDSRTVSLRYDSSVAVVESEVSFFNERQKASVSVVKIAADGSNTPLSGGEFTLYADEDIYSFDGKPVVGAGTALETAVSGEDGRAVFTADLPAGFCYRIEETKAPSGYIRNSENIYRFRLDPAAGHVLKDEENDPMKETLEFTYTFENKALPPEPETADISPAGRILLIFDEKSAAWNNPRTEDDGTVGSSILAVKEKKLSPFLVCGIAAVLAAGAGCLAMRIRRSITGGNILPALFLALSLCAAIPAGCGIGDGAYSTAGIAGDIFHLMKTKKVETHLQNEDGAPGLPGRGNEKKEAPGQEKDTITVTYSFCSDRKDNPDYDFPQTVEKNGRTYRFTGNAEYRVSEVLKTVEQTVVLEVSSLDEIEETMEYTSARSGRTYLLSNPQIQTTRKAGIPAGVTDTVTYSPRTEEPDFPDVKIITYFNKVSGQDEQIEGTLTGSKKTGEPRWQSGYEITGLFTAEDDSTGEWVLDGIGSIVLSPDADTPVWEGYESDILTCLGLDHAKYRITGASWSGDPYRDENGLFCRKAVYSGEALVTGYEAVYEGTGHAPGYRVTVNYSASAENADAAQDDITVTYKLTALATYEEL